MDNNRLRKLVFAALFTALCCVFTMYPKFPTPLGYIHGGDAFVVLAAFVLGPGWGAAAAGIGSALADVLSGYAQYALATFVIKALMSICAALILNAFKEKRGFATALLAGVAAEIVMILGYLGYEALLLGYGAAALGSVPTNCIQAAFGAVVGAAFFAALQKADFFRRYPLD